MALSKEMKDYIARKMDEKINKINKECNEECAKAEKDFCSTVNRQVHDTKNIIDQMIEDILFKYPSVKISTSWYDNSRKMHYDVYAPNTIGDSIRAKYAPQINALKAEKEKLLVRLSMEKDFDRINMILADYGIAI